MRWPLINTSSPTAKQRACVCVRVLELKILGSDQLHYVLLFASLPTPVAASQLVHASICINIHYLKFIHSYVDLSGVYPPGHTTSINAATQCRIPFQRRTPTLIPNTDEYSLRYLLVCIDAFIFIYMIRLEKVALAGSVECCAPPPRWCDLEL